MSLVDYDFCPMCGFLKQEKKLSRCKACVNIERELTQIKADVQKCTCEYCAGIGFHDLKDSQDIWELRNLMKEDEWTNEQLDGQVNGENQDIPVWSEWPPDDFGDIIYPNSLPYAMNQSASDMVPSDETRDKWMQEQNILKQKLILEDSKGIRILKQCILSKNYGNKQFYIAGMDISFIKGDNVNACAALVVVSFPQLKVVYEDYEMIELTAPYIPGFLAFREASFLVDLYNNLISTQPEYKPDVIFLDGNGILHPRECGIASHVGVLLNTPCLGVAKNLIHIDGLEDHDEFKNMKTKLKKGGDTVPLKNATGTVLGVAMRSLDSTTNPIYVSVGHLISLETANILVKACCLYRIPEPVRQADLNSREYLRRKE